MSKRTRDLIGFIDLFKHGFSIDSFSLQGRVWKGRFPEETNIEVFIEKDNCRNSLFHMKVFRGRLPLYRPWIEIHTILSSACGVTFDGLVEDTVLDLLSIYTGPGGRVFIEYEWDPVTMRELEVDIPPAFTRLGYKLLVRGFTWFKDWYYAEGFMEGGRKLQAEKPVSPQRAKQHLQTLALDAKNLLEKGLPSGMEKLEYRIKGILILLDSFK